MFLDKEKRVRPYIFWFFIHFVLTTVFIFTLWFSSVSVWISFVFCILLGLFFIIYGFGSPYLQRIRFGSILFGLILFIVAYEGLSLEEYKYIKNGKIERDVSVNAVSNNPDSTKYYFSDGKVSIDQMGEYVVESPSYNSDFMWYKFHHYYVFPVVSESWNISQPVRVWAVCQGFSEVVDSFAKNDLERCKAELSKDYRAGVKILYGDGDMYQPALQNALQKYNLISVDDPVFIHWVATPENTAPQDLVKHYYELLIFYNYLWFAIGIFGIVIDLVIRFIERIKYGKKLSFSSKK